MGHSPFAPDDLCIIIVMAVNCPQLCPPPSGADERTAGHVLGVGVQTFDVKGSSGWKVKSAAEAGASARLISNAAFERIADGIGDG